MRAGIEVAMGCRAIRAELNEALAAGEAKPLDRDGGSHLQACSGCRDYYSAQSRLYGAIDSGVRKLVENVAPPSLLPGVRERLAAEPQPNRAWVRAFVPSTAALLVACGLLLLVSGYMHRAGETRTTLVPPASNYSVVPDGEELSGGEGQTVGSNRRPKTPQRVSTRPQRVAITTAQVIVDPREAAAFLPMTSEIARNPEFGLAALHKSASPVNLGQAIEPVSIAKLDIPALVEEKE
jgi:hypothetical protein